MELTEPIESINSQLVDLFGKDTISGIPIWRVVWSEEQFEKRLGTYDNITPSGLYLGSVTEVRLVPKYRQWITKKYVLERLVAVPDSQQNELPTSKVSYEPIYVFEDGNGDYLPPKSIVAKFVIDTIYAAQYGGSHLKKYIDDEYSQEASLDAKAKRINSIFEEMTGEESSLGGTTVSGESIIVPTSYERGN